LLALATPFTRYASAACEVPLAEICEHQAEEGDGGEKQHGPMLQEARRSGQI
jgi:hypothetical protein